MRQVEIKRNSLDDSGSEYLDATWTSEILTWTHSLGLTFSHISASVTKPKHSCADVLSERLNKNSTSVTGDGQSSRLTDSGDSLVKEKHTTLKTL